MLAERIGDICRFINTFQTAISLSAPHIYISSRPFLPSATYLSATVFRKWFTKGMKVERGRLLSWPSPPLEWVGHTQGLACISYSPNGCYIVSGSRDNTIRIWDAETGHAVGKPLVGHTKEVRSVAYSPDGRHIISGSFDKTIRIWDAEAGSSFSKHLEGHTHWGRSAAYSPDSWNVPSASTDRVIHSIDSVPIRSSSTGNQLSPDFCSPPDQEGWVRDPEGGLLYWVPPDCRIGLHSPALFTIPPTSHIRSVSLDFKHFVFGTSWAHVSTPPQP